MTRTARTAAAALTVSALLLTGCTVNGTGPEDEGEAAPDGPATSGGTPAADGSEALTSDEISTRLLDRGEALAEREPVATVEAEVPLTPAPAVLTLDIIEVVASPSGTVVEMQVSAPHPVSAQVGTFSAEQFANPEYIADIDLVDVGAQEAFRPVAAAEGGRWCQCSAIPGGISSIPTPLTATFPAIDGATTAVDIRFGNFPVVEGVPVTR